MKYSSIDSPSRKFAMIGLLDDLADAAGDLLLRLGHQAAHAGQLLDLVGRAAGAGVVHHVDRVEALVVVLQVLEHAVADLVGHLRPDVDHLVVPLAVRDDAVAVLADVARRRPSGPRR